MVNNRAFTLIELIVVLVLVSTLLLIALPSVRDTLSAHPVRTEARKLAEIIEDTRSRAIREQRDYTLNVDIEKGRFRTCRSTEPAELQERSGNTVWNLPDGVRIAGIQFGNGEVQNAGEARLLFSGQSYAQPAVIHLLRDNLSISLTIRPFMNAVEIQEESIEAAGEMDTDKTDEP